MKKFITVLMVFSMLLATPIAAKAQAKPNTNYQEKYILLLSELFSNPENCQVIAKNGVTNITDKFIDDNMSNYRNGDFQKITEYAQINVSFISGPPQIQTYSTYSSRDYVDVVKWYVEYPTCELTGRNNVTLAYYVHCPMYVNNNEGLISEVLQPNIEIWYTEYEGAPDDFTTSYSYENRQSSVLSGGLSSVYNVAFRYYVNVHTADGIIPIFLAYRYYQNQSITINASEVVSNPLG